MTEETEDFWQVLREMDCTARGEDADPEFDDEQMALIADWHARILKVLPAAASSDAAPVTNEAWVGSTAAPGAQPAQGGSVSEAAITRLQGLVAEAELCSRATEGVSPQTVIEAAQEAIQALSAARASAPAAPEVVEALHVARQYAERVQKAGKDAWGPTPDEDALIATIDAALRAAGEPANG